MDLRNGSDRYTGLVVGAAALLFTLSAYNVARIGFHELRRTSLERSIEPRQRNRSTSSSDATTRPSPKRTVESAVANVTYLMTPEDCQFTSTVSSGNRPKIHAGALLKLIDVAAGVAARRHAGGPCVTISVDSVILLKPIYLGDLVHVSASVNRAWGSSMEVGVRITKESTTLSANQQDKKLEYVSHSYLTFVALSREASKPKKASSSWFSFLNTLNPSIRSKPVLAPIEPTSRLESRRHLLAGRRRTKRLDDADRGISREGVSVAVKRNVRNEVIDILNDHDCQAVTSTYASNLEKKAREDHIRAIEIEVIIQAWIQGEPGVTTQDGFLEVNSEGDEPLRYSESEVRAHAKKLGVQIPQCLDFDESKNSTPTVSRSRSPIEKKKSLEDSFRPAQLSNDQVHHLRINAGIDVHQTLTTTMHLVFPQHTNSHGIIFGGNTMSWCEEVAIMACRKIQLSKSHAPLSWKTVAMDGLEFTVQVGIGELMIFSAIIIKTYEHSCEVYVIAQAENLQGERRFTNDVLFTMAFEQEEGSSIYSQIRMRPDSALEEFSLKAGYRRQRRLELRNMLLRVYGNPE